MKDLTSDPGYYPQIDVSGKDVIKLIKKESLLGINDEDLTYVCKLLHLFEILGHHYLTARWSAFLSNLNKSLKKYNIGAKDLLYAFPDSNGTVVVDGNKYKNVGSPNLGSVNSVNNPIGIVIFSIVEKNLKKNKKRLMDSLKDKVKTSEECSHIVSEINNLDPCLRFSYFFAGRTNVISEECKKLILTDGVEKITPNACKYCEQLTSVSFPDTLKIIGHDAFRGCTNLNNVKIPGSVKTIGDDAFCSCTNLKDLKLKKGIVGIKDRAFYDCDLRSVSIPDSVKRIGNLAFSTNDHLENVNIKEGTQVIGVGAFANEIVKEIKLPSSVKTLEGHPFDKNSSFKSQDKTTTYILKTKEINDIKESKEVRKSEPLYLPKEKVQEL